MCVYLQQNKKGEPRVKNVTLVHVILFFSLVPKKKKRLNNYYPWLPPFFYSAANKLALFKVRQIAKGGISLGNAVFFEWIYRFGYGTFRRYNEWDRRGKHGCVGMGAGSGSGPEEGADEREDERKTEGETRT